MYVTAVLRREFAPSPICAQGELKSTSAIAFPELHGGEDDRRSAAFFADKTASQADK